MVRNLHPCHDVIHNVFDIVTILILCINLYYRPFTSTCSTLVYLLLLRYILHYLPSRSCFVQRQVFTEIDVAGELVFGQSNATTHESVSHHVTLSHVTTLHYIVYKKYLKNKSTTRTQILGSIL